jgi:hypothetical protein
MQSTTAGSMAADEVPISINRTLMVSRRKFLILLSGLIITILNVSIIWSHRFLPLYDYPIWLYCVRIMRGLADGNPLFMDAFESVSGPVPNMAFMGGVWSLSYVTSLEVAGKLLLTVCVSAFPWVWWWSSRRIAAVESPWTYLGFPFALNLFLWGRLGYLLAFILLLLVLGVFLPRALRLTGWSLAILAVVSVLFFLLHGVVFVVWSIVMVLMLLRGRDAWKRKAWRLTALFGPSLLCAFWYGSTMTDAPWNETSSWGLGAMVRSALKPLMLCIKSYGIASPGPVSVYNILWLTTLFACAIAYAAEHKFRFRAGGSWLAAGALVLGCGIVLPLNAFGVFQPGAYFVLPALFLLSVSARSVRRAGMISAVMVFWALCVSLYCSVLVSRVDSQMQEFYHDFSAAVDVSQPHTVVSLDWPAGTGASDVVSASVNPLFGVPFYSLLERDGLSWIFETSMIRLKPGSSWLRSPASGETRSEYRQSIEDHLGWYLRFPQIVVTGANESSASLVTRIERSGYHIVRQGSAWTILLRKGRE